MTTNDSIFSGRTRFPAAPRPASTLPPGYMLHSQLDNFIVSVDHGFLRDKYGNIKMFSSTFLMEDYCKRHAEQCLRSDEVAI